MKKICILFVSCILWFCSFGQGTAYLTKSYASGYSKLIRQYSNSPGQHVVIFTDDVTDTKCYIGVTDVYTNIKGTSINCPGGANFQYPRTNSVGYIKQIHHSVLKARALKNELIEPT